MCILYVIIAITMPTMIKTTVAPTPIPIYPPVPVAKMLENEPHTLIHIDPQSYINVASLIFKMKRSQEVYCQNHFSRSEAQG